MPINPVPKPVKAEKPKSRTPLKRTPVKKHNPERQARVKQQRAKDRRSPAEKLARQEGWERAQGICECGACHLPFDKTFGPQSDDYPEWHHDNYRKRKGRWLRRWCHHYLESTKYSYRRHGT